MWPTPTGDMPAGEERSFDAAHALWPWQTGKERPNVGAHAQPVPVFHPSLRSGTVVIKLLLRSYYIASYCVRVVECVRH